MNCLNRVITSINNCIKNLSQELDQELSQEFANNKLSNELSNEVRKKVSDAMAEKLRTDRGKTEPIITNLKGALNNTADCELKKYISLKDRSEYKQIVEAIDNFFSARGWLYHKVNSLYDKISSFILEPDPNKQSLEERLYLSWLKYVSNALCKMPVITEISADLADLKNLLKDSELPKSKLDQLRFIEVIDGLSSVSEIIQSVNSAKVLFNQFICEYAEITKKSKINELIAKAKALSDGILPFPVPPRPGSFSEK